MRCKFDSIRQLSSQIIEYLTTVSFYYIGLECKVDMQNAKNPNNYSLEKEKKPTKS